MTETIRSASVDATSEPAENAGGGEGLFAAGGILAALGASSCCVLPLLLFSLGVGGAWIGNLTALSRYQPVFVAAALGFLAVGFWRVYRRPKQCASDSACARPRSNRAVKIGLWTAAVLIVAAVAFPYAAPLIL